MSHVEPPDWSDPTPHDVRGPYRARHIPAAPEAYERNETYEDREESGRYGFMYGDGLSPYPLYADEHPAPWEPSSATLAEPVHAPHDDEPPVPAGEAGQAPEAEQVPAPEPAPDTEQAPTRKRRAGRN